MISAVIVAGGKGKRMGRNINKQYIKIDGREILSYTIEIFEKCNYIDEIIIVTGENEVEYCIENIVKKYGFKKVTGVVKGGKERQESVFNGLSACNDNTDIVIIHDGARPFVGEDIICKSVECAKEYGACATAVPVKDTIKIVNKYMEIKRTPDRSTLFAVQTPQTFKYDIILNAHNAARKEGFLSTDDTALVENQGNVVKIIKGNYSNIKITTPEDLVFAEEYIKNKNIEMYSDKRQEEIKIRIGHGYDVHRLVENRELIIGGVKIPYDRGLLGHSDADVLLHAIMDALLGAAALGDIGMHFPDSDEKYKDADSLKLLRYVGQLLYGMGYKISNIDSTIIAQAPKIAPYIEKMKGNIAEALNINKDSINIKATTEEGLGFTGRGDGISSHSVCIIY